MRGTHKKTASTQFVRKCNANIINTVKIVCVYNKNLLGKFTKDSLPTAEKFVRTSNERATPN